MKRHSPEASPRHSYDRFAALNDRSTGQQKEAIASRNKLRHPLILREFLIETITPELRTAMSINSGVSADEVNNWFEEEEDAPVAAAVTVDVAEKYARSQLRVVRETKDYQLDYLRHALQPGRELIDTSPTYQRRLRWTTKNARYSSSRSC